MHIRKGQGVPAYSIFEGTDDAGRAICSPHGASPTSTSSASPPTTACGRARSTRERGQHVRVFTDLVAGVAAESSTAALAELGHAGVVIAESTVLDEAAS